MIYIFQNQRMTHPIEKVHCSQGRDHLAYGTINRKMYIKSTQLICHPLHVN